MSPRLFAALRPPHLSRRSRMTVGAAAVLATGLAMFPLGSAPRLN